MLLILNKYISTVEMSIFKSTIKKLNGEYTEIIRPINVFSTNNMKPVTNINFFILIQIINNRGASPLYLVDLHFRKNVSLFKIGRAHV